MLKYTNTKITYSNNNNNNNNKILLLYNIILIKILTYNYAFIFYRTTYDIINKDNSAINN